MRKIKLFVFIVLLGNFSDCLQHGTHKKFTAIKSNKKVAKKIYYLDYLRYTITVENKKFFKNSSLFALLNDK